MSTQRLPVVTLTCRNGHDVPTRARGGQAVKCPNQECRVSVWVPADRQTGETGSGDEGDSFAHRWENEPEVSDEDSLTESPHSCETCGSVQYWEPGRTMLICPKCQTASLPPTIAKQYAEIEVRKTAPDPVAMVEKSQTEMRQRMRVTEERDRLIRVAESWAEFVDPDRLEDDSPISAICVGLESNLRHVVSELKRTIEPIEIVAAKSLLVEIITKVREHEVQIKDEHARAAANDEDDEDDEDDGYEDDESDYIEGEVVEDDNPAGLSPYQRYLLQNGAQRQPWNQVRPAIAPQRQPTVLSGNQVLSNIVVNRAIAQMTHKNCQFDHFWGKRATRKMWGASFPGEPLYSGRPVIYCCEAHNDQGIRWLEAKGYPNSTFEMLEAES